LKWDRFIPGTRQVNHSTIAVPRSKAVQLPGRIADSIISAPLELFFDTAGAIPSYQFPGVSTQYFTRNACQPEEVV
jgi:hypothetical protein